MKKLLAALLCVVCMIPGMALAEDDLQGKLLDQWMDYLCTMEAEVVETLWATGACETFLEEPTWENLIYARAAVATAGQRALSRPIPEEQLTGEDYVALLLEGKDVLFISEEMQGYAKLRKGYPNPVIELEDYVEFDLFWKVCWKGVGDDLANRKMAAVLDAMMCAQMTQKLLLALDSPAEAEFFAQMQALCPKIASFMEGLPEDDGTLMAQNGAAADMLEDALKAQEEGRSLVMTAQDLYLDAFDKLDVDFLVENAAWIEGMPPLLPYPVWYDPWTRTAEWIWEDAQGNPADPLAGKGARPVGCVITCPGVTKQELAEYREELGWLEMDTGEWIEDGASCTLIIGDAQFRWKDNAVEITLTADGTGLAEYGYAYLNS